MLKRYWFVIYPNQRYGPFNAGVTAFSVQDARELLLKNFTKIHYLEPLQHMEEIGKVEVIENIDVQLLNQESVIPNMGPVIFRGVWFPRLNLHEEV